MKIMKKLAIIIKEESSYFLAGIFLLGLTFLERYIVLKDQLGKFEDILTILSNFTVALSSAVVVLGFFHLVSKIYKGFKKG